MKLCILIPAFNEEETIVDVIGKIPKRIDNVDEIITLVVDDGSSDRTVELSKARGACVISHSRNLGVGSAFNTGLNTALKMNADIFVNIDADGQFSPSEIPYLITPILENNADFVCGDRFSDTKGNIRKPKNMSSINYWGNRRMSQLISILINSKFNDVSCGFRAYSKEAMLQLNLTGKFTYTQETFIDLMHKGLIIKSLPVNVTYFHTRKSRVADNILKYMARTIKIIFRAYRDYRPFLFFGWLGLINFFVGVAFGGFTLTHFFLTGKYSPYKAVGILGIYFVSIGILLWIVGLLADMFVRLRLNQEQILYYEKFRRYIIDK